MKAIKIIVSAAAVAAVIAMSTTAMAGKGNGKEPAGLAKLGITLDQTINSDASRGNGGERNTATDLGWKSTPSGEDGMVDVDPGNSGGNNNACPTPDGMTRKDTLC